MGNTWFSFKEFTIHQDRCAMKVTTDSCLFGAWAASRMAEIPAAGHPIMLLDIGAGTGLLTLMCLQANPGFNAVAVELDHEAYGQALENVEASTWRENIDVRQGDIRLLKSEKPFDIIISNPPFHENQLAGDQINRNLAHHDSGLLLEELPEMANKLSAEKGHFFLLLPFYRQQEAIDRFTDANWHLAECVNVRQSEMHGYFRTMFHFQKAATGASLNSSITIREGQTYSPEFSHLLKPYYLKL